MSLQVAPELPSLPAAIEVAIYRITAEALSNAARHAGANTCTVRLMASCSDVLLEIVDDGRGLTRTASPGIGVESMRERAQELGGSCTLERAYPSGTRVVVKLPVPP